jgi:hypothetical protein
VKARGLRFSAAAAPATNKNAKTNAASRDTTAIPLPTTMKRLARNCRGAMPAAHKIGQQVARMSVSEIRGRHSSLTIAPGFHGACHRAGHFGPDPLVHPGYKLGDTSAKSGIAGRERGQAAAPPER